MSVLSAGVVVATAETDGEGVALLSDPLSLTDLDGVGDDVGVADDDDDADGVALGVSDIDDD